MYKNIKVEAEHNELILENSHGDKVIIPANKRNWVKQKLSEDCHGCIDSLVETLPVASQYAQDGSVYPPGKKVKVNQDNQIKEYDISSPEYRDLYNTGRLVSYDKTTDTYTATPLKEVTVTAEAPQWLKDKRKYESQYSRDWYIDNIMPKFSRSMGVSANNMHPNNVKEYDAYINDKVAESILKRNPKVGSSNNERLAWYNSLSEKERDIVNNSYFADKFSPAVRAYMESQSNGAKKYGILETFRDVDKLAQSVEGTPERFRIFPNAENNYENYVNPLMWIGDMAKGLGNVPKDIKEENYLKAAGSVASPLLGGALGGLGAKTTGQFIKNTFLPLGGLEENVVKALQEDVVDLYRIQEKGAKTFSQLAAEGKIPKVFNNEKIIAKKAEEEKYFGQWFTKDKADLDWYARDREFTNPEIIHLKVPKSKLSQYQNYDKTLSRAPEREFVIPHAEQKLYNVDATKVGSKVEDVLSSTNRIKFDDFKNDNEFFRIIVGDEAFDDIVKTGQIRVQRPSSYKTEPGVINLDRRGTTPSPSFSKGEPSIEYAKGNPEHYIIRTSEPLKPSTMGAHGKGSTMFPTDEAGKHLKSLDASKTQVYKHVGNGEYELVNLDKVSEKVITENVVKAGFPNPLTLLTKPKTLIDNILGRNQLEKNTSNLYRKIGNKKGLKSLIENEGAISPGYDNVWFSKGSPNEDYNGVFAVELSSDKIGIGKNEISKGKGLQTGYKVTNKNNIPLEDLKVYRRRFLSTAYKEIDKTKLANELKTANIQNYIEKLWKYGSQGYLLHEFLAHEFPKDFDKWTPKIEKFYKEKIKPANNSLDEYMWNLITNQNKTEQ